MILSADALVAPAVDGPGWLQTEGDRIVALGSGVVAADAHFPVLVPGFVDVHVHGGAGAAFPGGDVEDALRAVAFHRAHGTTTTLASLVTAAPEELRRAVDALAELVVDGVIAGVHLEGPWLAAARCGAHDPAQLRDPDPAELDELLATGVVAMVTLAPERVRRARRRPPGRRGGRGGRGRAHRRRLRADPRGDRRRAPGRHPPVQRHAPRCTTASPVRSSRCWTTTA